jgi:hypothetical protein
MRGQRIDDADQRGVRQARARDCCPSRRRRSRRRAANVSHQPSRPMRPL